MHGRRSRPGSVEIYKSRIIHLKFFVAVSRKYVIISNVRECAFSLEGRIPAKSGGKPHFRILIKEYRKDGYFYGISINKRNV